MSFREKCAWISLLSVAGIYGFYFWSVIQAGPKGAETHFGLLDTIVALVVVKAMLTIAVAKFTPGEAKVPRDEREQLIDLRATQVAYTGLATSVAFVCFFGAFDPPLIFNTNAILFILVAAEIIRCAAQIIQYRRTA